MSWPDNRVPSPATAIKSLKSGKTEQSEQRKMHSSRNSGWCKTKTRIGKFDGAGGKNHQILEHQQTRPSGELESRSVRRRLQSSVQMLPYSSVGDASAFNFGLEHLLLMEKGARISPLGGRGSCTIFAQCRSIRDTPSQRAGDQSISLMPNGLDPACLRSQCP